MSADPVQVMDVAATPGPAHLTGRAVGPAAHVPGAAAMPRYALLQELIMKSYAHQLQACAGLFRLAMSPQSMYGLWDDLISVQSAVLQRLMLQQKQWAQGMDGIATEAASLQYVNTVSKFIDQESDLHARFQALCLSQITALTELGENVQVSVNYLVAQRENEASA